MALIRASEDDTSITTVYTPAERLKAAGRWWGFGAALTIVLALCGFANADFFGGAMVSAVAFAVIGFVVYMRREETKLTPHGEALRQSEYRERNKDWIALDAWTDKILAMRVVRYPLAALLFWWAYDMSQDPKVKTGAVVLITLGAMMAAYDLILWVVGIALVIGVLSLVFHWIAAIPVGVAVIIGALIIASAVKK